MDESQITALLERILGGDRPDELIGAWIEDLERATGCPHIQDLIKYRKPGESAQDILRKAREYRPIQL